MTEITRSKALSLFRVASSLLRPGLVGNLLSLGAAAAISRALAFATVVYTARVLGKDAFGLLSFGTAVAAYAAILAGPGLLIWGVRAVARDHQQAGNYLAIINLTQAALAGAAYLGLYLVAKRFFSEAERQIALMAGLGIFAIAASVEWVGQGLERFKLIGATQILTSFLTLTITLLGVRSPSDVYRVPLISAGSQLFGTGALFLVLLHNHSISFETIHWSQVGTILRSALPLGVSSAMITILHYSNNLFVQFFQGSGALGLFGAAFRLLEILTIIPGMVSYVFLPRLSWMYKSDPEGARRVMGWYIQVVMSLAFLPVAVYVIEAPEIVRLIYGPEFMPAADLLRVIGLAVTFNFAAVAYINGLLAFGRDRAYFWSLCVAMVISIGGGLLLVPRVGVWGATITVACLDLATWLVALSVYQNMAGSWYLGEWLRPVLGGLLLASWLTLGQWLGLAFWLRLPIGVLAYGILVTPWRMLKNFAATGTLLP